MRKERLKTCHHRPQLGMLCSVLCRFDQNSKSGSN